MRVSLIETIPVGNMLGEGVLWDDRTQSLWWTDIEERRLFRLDWASRNLETMPTPERVGSFGLTASGDRLIIAFESGFGLFDWRSGTVEWLTRPESPPRGLRFNDGRVDRQGRFWAGTMVEDTERAGSATAASLYRLDPDGQAHPCLGGIGIANGACWSPDGSRFYFADSPTRTISVFDFEAASGTLGERRVFATTPESAFPDGATVDAAGYLWSATWGAGQVIRYAANGSIDCIVDTPTRQPTCVAFGGPNLDLLFVTSARAGLSAHALKDDPHAGDLFVYATSSKGIAECRYRDERRQAAIA